MLRILANLILFGSVLFFPWWLMALIAVVAVFIFNRFYEIIVWGLVADLLYGVPVAAFYNFGFFLALGAIVIFLGIEYLKTKLRFYT